MKILIMKELKKFTKRHGMLFTSEEDAIDFYKDLVELIEKIYEKTDRRS